MPDLAYLSLADVDVYGDPAGLNSLAALATLSLRNTRIADDWWPFATESGRTFAPDNTFGTYSGADDPACAAVICEAPNICAHGTCIHALLAFKASGNGVGLESWVEGSDPCAAGWAWVCCSEGGWDYPLPGGSGIATCRAPRGSGVVTGLNLRGVVDYDPVIRHGAGTDMSCPSATPLRDLVADVATLAPLAATLQTLHVGSTVITGNVSALSTSAQLAYLNTQGDCIVRFDVSSCGNFANNKNRVFGDVASLRSMSSLAILDVAEHSSSTGTWPLVTDGGRTFHRRDLNVGTYFGGNDVTCGDVTCVPPMVCSHGDCTCGAACAEQRATLLAFNDSGNGFFGWVDGGDPCADHWPGVCCGEDGCQISEIDTGPYALVDERSMGTGCELHYGCTIRTQEVGNGIITGLMLRPPTTTASIGSYSGDISTLLPFSDSLMTLDLRGADITGDIASLGSMTGLTYLIFGGTGVSGHIEALGGLTQLTHLDLHGCSVTGPVSALAGLNRLSYLRISNSYFERYVRTADHSWPLVTDSGRIFRSMYDAAGFYSAAYDHVCDRIVCDAPLVCSHGSCGCDAVCAEQRAALLASRDSGNGHGLDGWVEGGDPCADRWVGVCCREGGWLSDGYQYAERTAASHHSCPMDGSGTGVVTGLRLAGKYGNTGEITATSSCALYSLTGDVRLLSPLNTTLVTFSIYDLRYLQRTSTFWSVEAQGGCVMQISRGSYGANQGTYVCEQ